MDTMDSSIADRKLSKQRILHIMTCLMTDLILTLSLLVLSLSSMVLTITGCCWLVPVSGIPGPDPGPLITISWSPRQPLYETPKSL